MKRMEDSLKISTICFFLMFLFLLLAPLFGQDQQKDFSGTENVFRKEKTDSTALKSEVAKFERLQGAYIKLFSILEQNEQLVKDQKADLFDLFREIQKANFAIVEEKKKLSKK